MRRYRFAYYVVEGDGSHMKTVEVGSRRSLCTAKEALEEHRLAKRLSRKRVGIFDRKYKRWVDMPWVLHAR